MFAIGGGKWPASCHRHSTPPPQQRPTSTCWTGSCVGLRASLDVLEERQISCP